jgi:hypothetical protein
LRGSSHRAIRQGRLRADAQPPAMVKENVLLAVPDALSLTWA